MKDPETSVAYFKQRKGYDRIFLELRKKWKRNGKCTGKIQLKDAAALEREELRKLLGRRFDDEIVAFDFQEFEQAYTESSLYSIPFIHILEIYFGEPLLTNKESKEQKENQRQSFFTDLIKATDDLSIPESKSFFSKLQQNETIAASFVSKEYNRSPDAAKQMLINAWKALAYLFDQKTCRLAVLSTAVTGNPHYFDRNLNGGKALLYVLAYYYDEPFPKKAEETLKLYDTAGIIIDEISNFTTAFGIHLYDSNGLHPAFEVFNERKEPYLISTFHLNRIVKADADQRVIYAVENQMLFSQLCEALRDRFVAVLCTSGQPKVASLLMLDMLCKSGCTIYYSGDLDPEGIMIADRLIARNPKQIHPWHYSVDDYEQSLSEEHIGDSRLKQLDKVKCAYFQPLIKALRQHQRAGYQEALLKRLIEDAGHS